MAIASTVEDYLAQRGVEYEVVAHPRSHCSMETAELAHVRGGLLVKSVVLEDDDGFLMAVLPSNCHVRLGELSRQLERKLRLATEDELKALFADCEVGAIPPIGLAYGLPTIIDETLATQPEVWFEAGDHESLIHMKRADFGALMTNAGHARFAARL